MSARLHALSGVIAVMAFSPLIGSATPRKTSEVVIGLTSNFSAVSSGSFNPYGDYFRDGIQLALKDSSKLFARKGIHIKFQEFDYGTNSIRVLNAARNAAASAAIGVIGYNYSDQALLAAPIHQKAKLPMITPSATADRVGKMGAYIHTGCFNNQRMGKALADLARHKLNAQRGAIIVVANCAYCEDLTSTFEKEFIRSGGRITVQASILETDTDFSKSVHLLKKQNYDFVLVPNGELISARVIAALLKSGIQKPFLGGDGWGDKGKEFFAVLKGVAQPGQKFQGYSVSHWHSDLQDSRSVKFTHDYLAAFHKPPNDSAVLAYDAMLLMAQGILNSSPLTREGLEIALNHIKDFHGVTGRAVFNRHSAPLKEPVILAVSKNRFKVMEQLND